MTAKMLSHQVRQPKPLYASKGGAVDINPNYEQNLAKHQIKSASGNNGDFAPGAPLHRETGGEVDRINMHYKDVTKRVPELTHAAQALEAGELTPEEYQEKIDSHKPVKPFSKVPRLATHEEMHDALHSDKKSKLYAARSLKKDHPVGIRLDIPSYTEKGVWTPTIHEQKPGGSFLAGKPIGYDSYAHIKNAEFGVHQDAATNYATGRKNKSTFAVMKGNWQGTSPEEAHALAKKYLNHPDWRQVGMDPERHSYFYDRHTQEPITHAEEAIQIGPLVLAKKPIYGNRKDFKYEKGGGVPINPNYEQNLAKNMEGAHLGAPIHRETGGEVEKHVEDFLWSANHQQNHLNSFLDEGEHDLPHLHSVDDVMSADPTVKQWAFGSLEPHLLEKETPTLHSIVKKHGLTASPMDRKGHYWHVEDPQTLTGTTIRWMKDHQQQRGGGFNPHSGERSGDSDIDVHYDPDGILNVHSSEMHPKFSNIANDLHAHYHGKNVMDVLKVPHKAIGGEVGSTVDENGVPDFTPPKLRGTQIMKEPGGHWLSGSVEDALKPLRKEVGLVSPEEILSNPIKAPNDIVQRAHRTKAVNDFVGKQLTRYVKNDMGTEGDPVRALAELTMISVVAPVLKHSSKNRMWWWPVCNKKAPRKPYNECRECLD